MDSQGNVIKKPDDNEEVKEEIPLDAGDIALLQSYVRPPIHEHQLLWLNFTEHRARKARRATESTLALNPAQARCGKCLHVTREASDPSPPPRAPPYSDMANAKGCCNRRASTRAPRPVPFCPSPRRTTHSPVPSHRPAPFSHRSPHSHNAHNNPAPEPRPPPPPPLTRRPHPLAPLDRSGFSQLHACPSAPPHTLRSLSPRIAHRVGPSGVLLLPPPPPPAPLIPTRLRTFRLCCALLTLASSHSLRVPRACPLSPRDKARTAVRSRRRRKRSSVSTRR
jgi:hypothetical protein